MPIPCESKMKFHLIFYLIPAILLLVPLGELYQFNVSH